MWSNDPWYKYLTNLNPDLSSIALRRGDGVELIQREFSNQRFHSMLNWRLGLDLARISMDVNAEINFKTEYWQSYVTQVLNGFDSYQTLEDSKYILDYKGGKILLSHPFWSNSFIKSLQEKYDFDEAVSITRIEKLSREIS